MAITGWRKKMSPDELAKFENRVTKTDYCWQWIGAKAAHGYGQMSVAGRQMLAHRAAYIYWVGEIPPRKELHHTCSNKSCVNPEHLQPLTHLEHVRLTPQAVRPEATTCCRGHDLTNPDIVRFDAKTGAKICRECCRIRSGTVWRKSDGVCKKGHKMTPDNLYSWGKKVRYTACLTCRQEIWKAWACKQKADRHLKLNPLQAIALQP